MGFNVNGSKMQLEVLPIPQRIKIIGNSPFIINSETRIVIEKDLRDSSKRVISYLRKEILQNFNFEPEVIQGKAKKNSVLLKIIENNKLSGFIPQDMRDQSYELSVNAEAAVIKAITQKGLFYGCVTLMQLLENYKGEIPSCEIIDWPDLKIRGISDDISRGQVSTQENFKRIIRFLARYKMNIYMPYLEDMIQFDSFPSIGKDRGALTKKEINELVEYASDYFIEVIPIFQTLGHFENVLSQKEFIKYADWPGAASLDVTNEETYKFLKSMLEEVFELFPSKYFHIGADESYDIGFGNSRKLVEETSLGRVHSDHYRRIYEICKDSGKDVMMYGDIILENPEILDNLPRDVIIVDWQYRPEADYPSAKFFMESGFDYIISPSVWNFNSVYPENFLAFPNIESLTRSGIEHNAMGMINSGWGDYGSETFRDLNLHGYAWSAQY